MVKIKYLVFCFVFLLACSTDSVNTNNNGNTSSGVTNCDHNGKTLYEGPQGGCYYINSNGNKTYVDRWECDC